MDGDITLFDFGMELQEPDLWDLELGQVFLTYDDWMECGAWKDWMVLNWVENSLEDGEYDVYLDHDSWHVCKDGHTEGCIVDELKLTCAYYKEDFRSRW